MRLSPRIAPIHLVAIVAGIAALMSAAPDPAPGATPDARPNVLIILTDDQRAGTVSVMSQTKRWFLDQGTRYKQAVTSIPRCCPARATIMTGRYAHNHGVLTNDDASHLDHTTTLQYYLQTNGYQTGIVGKFLNSWPVEDNPPYWDRWAIYDKGYFGRSFNLNGYITEPIQKYTTDYIREVSEIFLDDFEANDDEPWFLYVAPFAPHSPQNPPKRYKGFPVSDWRGNPGVFEEDLSDKPEFAQRRRVDFPTVSRSRKGQLRTLLAVDDLVGELMSQAHDLDETRDTIAFFLSDNGRLWGEHGLAGKGLPYSPSVQIPFIVRWPGHITKNATDFGLVATVDIAPTIVEATGIEVGPNVGKPPMDGWSLFGDHERDHLLIEHYQRPGKDFPTWAAFRAVTGEYVEYYADRTSPSFREYYDFATDPWELENELADSPGDDRTDKMSEELAADRRCSGTSCP